MDKEKKNVCIVVLGDIGRSPRMQYHSLSLAEKGHKVDILGYGGTDPMDQIKKSESVYYHYMCPVPHIPIKLVNYAFKTVFQALNLLFLLFTIRRPHVLMVQNPPAIPSLVVCWIFCRIANAKFIIDWHNYAHTIMALGLSKDHILVKVTEKCEAFIGTRADCNFCVTDEMKKDLLNRWNITAITLYDKPPKIFKPISLKEKHEFLLELGNTYKEILRESNETVFTKMMNGDIKLKEDRPGLLVSSTSWTEDEDFSVLFSALQGTGLEKYPCQLLLYIRPYVEDSEDIDFFSFNLPYTYKRASYDIIFPAINSREYENQHLAGNQRKLPDLICFITGKGQLKDYYCDKIAKQNWKHVKVITPWLTSSEYPLILASADLGVCLHTSSSGLDLPMKVVDMFGCCLPVLAFDFKCLHELVIDGKNSFTFKCSDDLSAKLLSWFENFPNNEEQIKTEKRFKQELEVFQKYRWQENWNNTAYSEFK